MLMRETLITQAVICNSTNASRELIFYHIPDDGIIFVDSDFKNNNNKSYKQENLILNANYYL